MTSREQREAIKGAAGCATAMVPIGLVLTAVASDAAGPVAGVAVFVLSAAVFAGAVWAARHIRHGSVVATPTAPSGPRKRKRVPREVREKVFRRDGGRCVECGDDFDLQYDHIIPWSLGGADSVENLQLLCSRCNQRKGNRHVH